LVHYITAVLATATMVEPSGNEPTSSILPVSLPDITIRAKATLANTRQRRPRLLHKRTSQACSPCRAPTHTSNLHSIGDHALGLVLGILQLRSGFVARERVIDVGKIDNGDLAGVVAAEEGRSFIEAFRDKGVDGRDEGHFCQACAERLNVCGQDLAAVGEVVAVVGRVVVDDYDVHASGRLKQGEYRVVLVCLASIN